MASSSPLSTGTNEILRDTVHSNEILRDAVHTTVAHACVLAKMIAMRHYEIPYILKPGSTLSTRHTTALHLTYAYATRRYTSHTRTYPIHTLPGTPQPYTSHTRMQHGPIPHIRASAYVSHTYATRHTTALYLTYAALWQEARVLKSILSSGFYTVNH